MSHEPNQLLWCPRGGTAPGAPVGLTAGERGDTEDIQCEQASLGSTYKKPGAH